MPITLPNFALIVPKTSINPNSKRFVFTIARRDARDYFVFVFRLFQVLATPEAVVPPLSEETMKDWRKGSHAYPPPLPRKHSFAPAMRKCCAVLTRVNVKWHNGEV